MKTGRYDKRLNIAKEMPPLSHSHAGQPFDVKTSHVAMWLCEQPEIMAYVFDKVSTRGGGLGFIAYDSTTGKWKGVGYAD